MAAATTRTETSRTKKSVDVSQLFRELGSSSGGLTNAEASSRLAKYGKNALEEKKKSALAVFLGFFWSPMAWMIEAAAVMALIVRNYGDFAVIALLLLFNGCLGFWEERQSSNALAALEKGLAQKARVLRDGVWSSVEATVLVPGDIVRLRLGDVIPADVALVSGDYLSVDQSALTGESLPVSKKANDTAYSGSIVRQGEMVALVTATGGKTFFGRTAALVQKAGAVSDFQKAVLKIGDFLLVSAAALAVVVVVVELSRGTHLASLAEFVLVILVASVPVAMPAVLSVTMALGAKALAKKQAIVSRLEAIEEMAGMDILCSDKTGTLTQNKLTLGTVVPWGGTAANDVLIAGAMASRKEDEDPIDLAVLAGIHDPHVLTGYRQTKFVPFDPISKRTEATATHDGASFQVAKGAPQVIFDLVKLSDSDHAKASHVIDEYASKGYRTLAVARADEPGEWKLLGILPMSDPPRVDSKETIARAEELGVKVKMVTGDNVAIAEQIAAQLDLGTNIIPASQFFPADGSQNTLTTSVEERVERTDGFAEVFPEHKYKIVQALQRLGHLTGMTGDGVNDAPALKQANVGIAVSGATDAARAAAALVLTAPGLSVIIDGIQEARRIFARMMSYTVYRIAITFDVMLFIVLATIVYGSFPLTPLMIIALALLDDIPIMAIAFDNASAAPRPVKWQMHRVLRTASLLGFIALVQSFGMMYIGKEILGLDRPHLQTLMFLQLVAGGHFMLFVTRSARFVWSRPLPAPKLFGAIVGTQIFAILMAGFGWLIPSLAWTYVALVYAYDFVWMLVTDLVWVANERHLDRREAQKTSFQEKESRALVPHGSLYRHATLSPRPA